MKHKDLIESLNVLAETLRESFDDISSGGCGVMAGMVGRHLERMGLVCDVATPTTYEQPNAGKIRNKVSDRSDPDEWSNNGLSRGHLAIRFRIGPTVHMWDSDVGVGCKGSYFMCGLTTHEFGLGLTVAECEWISSQQRGWSRCFCRSQIPDMQDLVDAYLSAFPDGCFSGIQGNRLLQFLLQRNQQVSERRC